MYAGFPLGSSSLGRFLAVLAVLLFGAVQEGYGQRVYATSVATSGTGVSNETNAISPPPGVIEPTATPLASISVSGRDVTGSITLQFGSAIPANSAVWLKVSDQFLGDGIGGDGGEVTVEAYNNSAPATGSNAEYITMQDGSEYYRVSATSAYNAVRVTAKGGRVLLGGNTTSSINVHYAFTEPPSSDCTTILGTSVSTSPGTVSNPERAIDGNINTHSTFAPPLLSLGGTMTQTVYLARQSNPGDAATVTFSLPGTLLELNLLSGVSIQTLNGDTEVSNVQINSLLGLDLLGLLTTGGKYTISDIPPNRFDRIVFRYNTGLLLTGNVNLYEVNHTPAPPTVPVAFPDVIEVCEGETLTLTATTVSDGSILRWYDDLVGGQLLQESSGNTDNYTTEPLPFTAEGDTMFLYVASAWGSGCESESQRTPIAIKVNQKLSVSPIVGVDEICLNESTPFSSATPGGIWSSSDESIATVDPASGEIIGVGNGTTMIRYTITNLTTGCASTVEKEITVNPLPGITLLPVAPICEGETVAALGYSNLSNSPDQYNIVWDSGAPPGFTNVTDAALPTSPISIPIPASAPMGEYTGTFTVRNSETGCQSVEIPFTLRVLPQPGKPHMTITDVQH